MLARIANPPSNSKIFSLLPAIRNPNGYFVIIPITPKIIKKMPVAKFKSSLLTLKSK
jgi:hypothetical protein